MTSIFRPQPNRDSQAWWDSLSTGVLIIQKCVTCEHLRWPPRSHCGGCGSSEWSWMQAAGIATVMSWSVSHRSPEPSIEAPFVVVLARLSEAADIYVPGFWAGARDGSDLVIGSRIRASFEQAGGPGGDAFTRIRWTPDPAR